MKPKELSSDISSTLPPSIKETILCLLPIQEAARTSILSSEWRYKWTKIPKMEFSEWMFKESTDDENQVFVSEQTMASERKKMGRRSKIFCAIYQVLLMRQGPIHEFALHMKADKTCVEIDPIISYLSRNNTVEKLTLDLYENEGACYRLTLSVFSFHHLTELRLSNCDLDGQPTFSGCARLTKLYLTEVYISMKTLLHILSNSLGLKHLTLEINKEHLIGDANSTVIELFKCLPVIEHLSTIGRITECFVIDSVPQDLPPSLIHLKSFYVEDMSFDSLDELHFLALLIRSSPNLEKIELKIVTGNVDNGMVSVALEEAYSDIKLENLKELEILGFRDLEGELEFVKFILANSPNLKKVYLKYFKLFDKNEESEILSILLSSPHASPVVEIIVAENSFLSFMKASLDPLLSLSQIEERIFL